MPTEYLPFAKKVVEEFLYSGSVDKPELLSGTVKPELKKISCLFDLSILKTFCVETGK